MPIDPITRSEFMALRYEFGVRLVDGGWTARYLELGHLPVICSTLYETLDALERRRVEAWEEWPEGTLISIPGGGVRRKSL